eukprot:Rmarinus@m.8902
MRQGVLLPHSLKSWETMTVRNPSERPCACRCPVLMRTCAFTPQRRSVTTPHLFIQPFLRLPAHRRQRTIQLTLLLQLLLRMWLRLVVVSVAVVLVVVVLLLLLGCSRPLGRR